MVDAASAQVATSRPRLSALAVIGLVLGVITFLISWVPFINLFAGYIIGPLAVVIGIAAILRTTIGGRRGRTLAIIGLAATLMGFVVLVFVARVYERVNHYLASGVDTSLGLGTQEDPLPYGNPIAFNQGFMVTVGEPTPETTLQWEHYFPDGIFYQVPITIQNTFRDPQDFPGNFRSLVMQDGTECMISAYGDRSIGKELQPGETWTGRMVLDCPGQGEPVWYVLDPDMPGDKQVGGGDAPKDYTEPPLWFGPSTRTQ